MTMKKIFATHDVYLSAYLALSGIQPTLEMEDHHRVVFEFPVTEELYKHMRAFNSNAAVPCIDFTTTIKKLRAQMLTLRDYSNEKTKG